MSPNPPRHSRLTLLLAFAILPAGLLVEQRMEGKTIGPVGDLIGLLLLLSTLALLIVPPLKRKLPWPERIKAMLLRLLLWFVFTAFTGVAFRVGKE